MVEDDDNLVEEALLLTNGITWSSCGTIAFYWDLQWLVIGSRVHGTPLKVSHDMMMPLSLVVNLNI